MSVRHLAMLAVAVLVFSTAANAQASTASGAQPAAPAVMNAAAANATNSKQGADPDPTICRVLPPPTGSRLGSRKVCRKKSQWDELREDSQDDLQKLQNKATLKNPQS